MLLCCFFLLLLLGCCCYERVWWFASRVGSLCNASPKCSHWDVWWVASRVGSLCKALFALAPCRRGTARSVPGEFFRPVRIGTTPHDISMFAPDVRRATGVPYVKQPNSVGQAARLCNSISDGWRRSGRLGLCTERWGSFRSTTTCIVYWL